LFLLSFALIVLNYSWKRRGSNIVFQLGYKHTGFRSFKKRELLR
jgi:hypothetical protein